MKNLKLSKKEIESKASAKARMQLEASDFRRLDRNDLLNCCKRFMVFLHHAKMKGYDEQLAMQEFKRDATESLDKFTKQNERNIIEGQQTWKENAEQAWNIFKKTIAPYWGDEMINWNRRFHDEVSGAKTEPIETLIKEQLLDVLTTDFTSMNRKDFVRKLLHRFEHRNFKITLYREDHMSEGDAKNLRIKAEHHTDRSTLFFNRIITLKPRIKGA